MEHWPLALLQCLPSDASQPYIRAALETIIFYMSPKTAGVRPDGSPRPEPEVRLLGSNLCVNGIFIPLGSRPLTLKLIASFFTEVDLHIDRMTILEEVYGYVPSAKEFTSERMTQSYDCNLNKLISRTRKLISDALSSAGWARNMNWIVFDAESKLWKLWDFKGNLDEGLDHPYQSSDEPMLITV